MEEDRPLALAEWNERWRRWQAAVPKADRARLVRNHSHPEEAHVRTLLQRLAVCGLWIRDASEVQREGMGLCRLCAGSGRPPPAEVFLSWRQALRPEAEGLLAWVLAPGGSARYAARPRRGAWCNVGLEAKHSGNGLGAQCGNLFRLPECDRSSNRSSRSRWYGPACALDPISLLGVIGCRITWVGGRIREATSTAWPDSLVDLLRHGTGHSAEPDDRFPEDVDLFSQRGCSVPVCACRSSIGPTSKRRHACSNAPAAPCAFAASLRRNRILGHRIPRGSPRTCNGWSSSVGPSSHCPSTTSRPGATES